MSKPSPRYDALRAMREANYEAEKARQRAEGVAKPVRRKKVKARRGRKPQ